MSSSLYEDSHRKLFKAFIKLVDDFDNQLSAILNSSSWTEVNSLLTIGGGGGILEAALLKNVPQASVWYLDPSEEQCAEFRERMISENLIERVKDITQSTFQDYRTDQPFDRILSNFSWFYIGTDQRWLTKLLALLTPNGIAMIVLPNASSIETIFYRALSPDKRMSLVGDDLVSAMGNLDCAATKDTYTKWLPMNDLFKDAQLSDGSLALAAFAGERPASTFSPDELGEIAELLKANQKTQGVPLSWDLIRVSRRS